MNTKKEVKTNKIRIIVIYKNDFLDFQIICFLNYKTDDFHKFSNFLYYK